MLFNSLEFLVFFPIVLMGYFFIPFKFRWIFLLISSYYFYICWDPIFVVLIIGSTLTDYFCSIKIAASKSKIIRKRLLYVSLIINLGLLFFFKYFNFFNDSIRDVVTLLGGTYSISNHDFKLPVGISFYTFQTLGYTIDVYKKRIDAEKKLLRFALYVTYFPQLVAGPIERAKNLIPQLRTKYEFNYYRVRNGLVLMLWGFVKKMVIADRIAEYTSEIFYNPGVYKGVIIWIANFFFYIQIYCDFSGYSDIAIGAAGIMGVKLMRNFRQPFFAQTTQEFWSRWHISLTTWFRDYLYVFLGGRRNGQFRMILSIIIVFLINGLWHGATWNFIIFGGVHGLFIVLYVLLRDTIKKIKNKIGLLKYNIVDSVLNISVVSLVFISTSPFFMTKTFSDALVIIRDSFSISISNPTTIINIFKFPVDFWISVLAILVLYYVEYVAEYVGLENWFKKIPKFLMWVLLLIGVSSIVFFGKWDALDFIYFQF
ncbi:MAG: MBOAT family protein [Marinilabiliaceae bacterium]|nr:MBOAT family protein [Marinilabiliaceae bacterium]